MQEQLKWWAVLLFYGQATMTLACRTIKDSFLLFFFFLECLSCSLVTFSHSFFFFLLSSSFCHLLLFSPSLFIWEQRLMKALTPIPVCWGWRVEWKQMKHKDLPYSAEATHALEHRMNFQTVLHLPHTEVLFLKANVCLGLFTYRFLYENTCHYHWYTGLCVCVWGGGYVYDWLLLFCTAGLL